MTYSLNQVLGLMTLALAVGLIGGVFIGRKSIRRARQWTR